MEIETGVTRSRSRISPNSERPIVWHGVTVVVEAGRNTVGDACIHADNRAGPEVPGQVIDADEVESMAPIVVGSTEFREQVIVIRGKKKQSTRIVHGLGKRVLANEIKIISQGRLQGDGQAMTARSCGRFELINVNKSGICPPAASRQRCIDVTSAVKL